MGLQVELTVPRLVASAEVEAVLTAGGYGPVRIGEITHLAADGIPLRATIRFPDPLGGEERNLVLMQSVDLPGEVVDAGDDAGDADDGDEPDEGGPQTLMSLGAERSAGAVMTSLAEAFGGILVDDETEVRRSYPAPASTPSP